MTAGSPDCPTEEACALVRFNRTQGRPKIPATPLAQQATEPASHSSSLLGCFTTMLCNRNKTFAQAEPDRFCSMPKKLSQAFGKGFILFSLCKADDAFI